MFITKEKIKISKKALITIFLLLFFTPSIFPQKTDTIEKLKYMIDTTSQDTLKIEYLFGIAREMYYYNTDTAILVCKEALDISKKNDYKLGLARGYGWLGYLYHQKGLVDSALDYDKKALEILENQENKQYRTIITLINNIAYIYDLRGDVPSALEYYTKALKMSEEKADTMNMIAILNNIATIYNEQGDSSNAKKYMHIVYELQKKVNDEKRISNTLNLLGNFSADEGDWDKALEYYKQALEIDKKYKNYKALGKTLINIGEVYLHRKQYDTALTYFNEALGYQKEIGLKRGEVLSYYDIALTYYNQDKLDKAKQNALKSLEIAKEISYPLRIKDAAELLTNIYAKQEDWERAYKMSKLAHQMQDSIWNVRNQKATIEQHLKYEYEKQAAIDSIAHAKEMEIRTIEAQRNRIQRNFTAAGLLLVLLFLLIILKNYREKKQANIILKEQKEELKYQNDLLKTQREDLDHKNKLIVSSLEYSATIQQALLPDKNVLDKYFDNFILYRPKDIVSGDGYWYSDDNPDFFFLAVYDCTGHGVPAAFLSIVGSFLLRLIVNEKKILQPNLILEELDKRVKNSLVSQSSRDGMDVVVVRIEKGKEQPQIKFSSAKLNVFYYTAYNSIVNRYKGARRSVGYTSKRNKEIFINDILQFNKDDAIYLMSDGFVDQNDINRRRFGKENFQRLIRKIGNLPMYEQYSILTEAITEYMAGTEQRDDMLIIGLKNSEFVQPE